MRFYEMSKLLALLKTTSADTIVLTEGLICNAGSMVGSVKVETFGIGSFNTTDGMMMNDIENCNEGVISYNGTDDTFNFDVKYGDCDMKMAAANNKIQFTTNLSIKGSSTGSIYLDTAFANEINFICSFSDSSSASSSPFSIFREEVEFELDTVIETSTTWTDALADPNSAEFLALVALIEAALNELLEGTGITAEVLSFTNPNGDRKKRSLLAVLANIKFSGTSVELDQTVLQQTILDVINQAIDENDDLVEIVETQPLVVEQTGPNNLLEASGNNVWSMSLGFYETNSFAQLKDGPTFMGSKMFMQVQWDATFSQNFPVRYFITDCEVSGSGKTFKIIDANCPAEIVNTSKLSADNYSKDIMQYSYNSFAFEEGENTANQVMACSVKFCLEDDLLNGSCDFSC